jgi:hypothetical protein
MGNTQSPNLESVTDYIDTMDFENTSVLSLSVFTHHDRIFVIVGEQHSKKDSEKNVFVKFIKGLCHNNPADVFIEGSFVFNKEAYRFKSRPETAFTDEDVYKMTKEKGIDTLDQSRRIGLLNCPNLRTHAIDVRDQGWMKYSREVVRPLKKECFKFYKEITECYSMTLFYSLQFVLKLARSSTRKAVPELVPVIDKHREMVVPLIEAAEGSRHMKVVQPAYSKLVDIYLLPRMFREDNHKLCVFYGGDNHAQAVMEAMKAFPNLIHLELEFIFPENDMLDVIN